MKVPTSIRFDPALGMSALFVPLFRTHQRPPREVHRTWGRASLGWHCAEALGVPDASVLLGVCALVQSVSGDPSSDSDCCGVVTTISTVARCAGATTGGAALASVRASLGRLSRVVEWVRDDSGVKRSAMLTVSPGPDSSTILLTLGPRLSGAIRGRQYRTVSLLERGRLSGEVARALHLTISCQLDAGRDWTWPLNRLEVAIWGDAATAVDARALRHRKVQAALSELAALPGWTVVVANGKACISRLGRGSFRQEPAVSQPDATVHRRNGREAASYRSPTRVEIALPDRHFERVDISEEMKSRGTSSS